MGSGGDGKNELAKRILFGDESIVANGTFVWFDGFVSGHMLCELIEERKLFAAMFASQRFGQTKIFGSVPRQMDSKRKFLVKHCRTHIALIRLRRNVGVHIHVFTNLREIHETLATRITNESTFSLRS